MLWRCIVAAVALVVAAAGPCRADQSGVAYGPAAAQVLDICQPVDAAGPLPAVLMFHGGGWRSGSRANEAPFCALVAGQGVVGIAVDYRLAKGGGQDAWPAQIEDAQLAMRWVRAHAAEYGIDPGRICAEGQSAGGQLALMLGTWATIYPGDMQGVLPAVSPHADCVASISGPSDLTQLAVSQPALLANLFQDYDPVRQAQVEAFASPALRVSAATGVPMLLVHGLADAVVPFAEATEMQAALAKAGIPVWLVTHPGGHVFVGLSGPQRDALFVMIARFVRANGLPGPPRRLTLMEATGGAG